MIKTQLNPQILVRQNPLNPLDAFLQAASGGFLEGILRLVCLRWVGVF